VLVYSATWCRDCREAKRFLEKHQIAYTEIDIESIPGAAEEVVRHVGKRAIPQFVLDGKWIQPNLILALVYDYLVESRGWNLPAARSVATTQMVDAAAKARSQTTFQTPVGFKYIGQLIREDKIALGGEESAGLTIRGHVPEKDGILAGLLVAEMIASRGASLGEQIQQMFKKLGREFWPIRENLHLSDEQKANAISKVAVDNSTLVGRKVVSIDRTDGAKFVFDDGSWMLARLSGTEPLLRLYIEADSATASAKLAREATAWILEN